VFRTGLMARDWRYHWDGVCPQLRHRFLGQGSGADRSLKLPVSQLRVLMDTARDSVATER
jgi:hypothetical protein